MASATVWGPLDFRHHRGCKLDARPDRQLAPTKLEEKVHYSRRYEATGEYPIQAKDLQLVEDRLVAEPMADL